MDVEPPRGIPFVANAIVQHFSLQMHISCSVSLLSIYHASKPHKIQPPDRRYACPAACISVRISSIHGSVESILQFFKEVFLSFILMS